MGSGTKPAKRLANIVPFDGLAGLYGDLAGVGGKQRNSLLKKPNKLLFNWHRGSEIPPGLIAHV
jgi:hypothetical protein